MPTESSSNPFRRTGTSAGHNDQPYQAQVESASIDPLSTAEIHQTSAYRGLPVLQIKPIKKVRVQSPPPISPDDAVLDSRQPIPSHSRDHYLNEQPYNSDLSESSREGVFRSNSRAPPNPFSRTLETLEHHETSERPDSTEVGSHVNPAGRGFMDVEAFKRLLMTGTSASATPESAADSRQSAKTPTIGLGQETNATTHTKKYTGHHLSGDRGNNSTDTSLSSKHSIFDPVQETMQESPRSSHELSEGDASRYRSPDSITNHTQGRKKPPPPSSRHGKLIGKTLRQQSDDLSAELSRNSTSLRSPTDLDKPPIPAPDQQSRSNMEAVYDGQVNERILEPPSPATVPKKKTAPAPPVTRRHSHHIASPKSPINEQHIQSQPEIVEEKQDTRSRSSSLKTAPPPPPPSRRPASVMYSPGHLPLMSPTLSGASDLERSNSRSSINAPPPPPSRSTSVRKSGKAPSITSIDSSIGKRSAAPPPPPPPPRQRASSRASVDAASANPEPAPPATHGFTGDTSMELNHGNDIEESEMSVPESSTNANNILESLNALQRDLDSYRNQYQQRRAS